MPNPRGTYNFHGGTGALQLCSQACPTTGLCSKGNQLVLSVLPGAIGASDPPLPPAPSVADTKSTLDNWSPSQARYGFQRKNGLTKENNKLIFFKDFQEIVNDF